MLFDGLCPNPYAINAAKTANINEDKNQIEETLAHQEQQINDLSEMLIAQSRDIEKLHKQLQKLEGRIEDVAEGDQQPANQNTPHY